MTKFNFFDMSTWDNNPETVDFAGLKVYYHYAFGPNADNPTHIEGILTTEHPQSSHGIPVFVPLYGNHHFEQGQAYGPGEVGPLAPVTNEYRVNDELKTIWESALQSGFDEDQGQAHKRPDLEIPSEVKAKL